MGTTTWNDTEEYTPRNNPVKIVIPLAIVAVLIIGAVLYFVSQQNVSVAFAGDYVIDGYYELTPAQIRIIEVVSGHAWIRHSAGEVNKAFECIGKYGTTKSFKTFGFKGSRGEFIPTNLWMCFDKDSGEWYTVITTVFEKIGQNKVARLITAYRVAHEIFPTIDSYIEHITNKWGAVVLNYAINAEKLYIQPFK